MSRLERARAAFEERAWREARELLVAADAESPLATEDLALLATAAHLCGDDDLGDEIRQRLFHECLREDDRPGASRAAFSLGMDLMLRGEPAQGGAWIGRASELAAGLDPDAAERGYVMLPHGLAALGAGDAETALGHFEQALSIGTTAEDADLCSLGRLGRGQSLLSLGRVTEGLETLDRAMVAVITEEVSPAIAGIVYCGVVEACHDIGDLGRSREWTRAPAAWCDRQPDLVPFRGRCLVHRSEVLQLDGSWDQSTDEARAGLRPAVRPSGPAPARGRRVPAGRAPTPSRRGRRGDPLVPSSERMRSRPPTRARVAASGDGRCRCCREDAGPCARRRPAGAATTTTPRGPRRGGGVGRPARRCTAFGRRARRSRRGRHQLGSSLRSPAMAGARVALVENEAERALAGLREAAEIWGELGAVYEVARTRELIGRACAVLGDLDTADLETSAARATFERLGAAPDVERIDAGIASLRRRSRPPD